MGFVAGLIGGALVVASFVGGVFFGRNLGRPAKAIELDDQAKLERERILEDRSAFMNMMSYNADTAYKKGGVDI